MEVLEEQAEEGGQLHADHGEDRVRVQFGRSGWTLDKNVTQMLQLSVGWSSIEVSPFAAVSNCPTPVSTCGVPIR